MKSVNSDYLQFIEENNFLDYAYRIELQRPDGKAYTYEGDVIQSFEINGTESSSGFSIGETLSLQLKLTLLLEERQGEKDIPTNSKLIPYIIYKWTEKVDDEVVNHEEETCMGIFYVNDVKADHRHKVSISAVDAMSATDIFGGTFTETQLTPPVDNRFIAQEIASLFPDDIVFEMSEEPGLVVNTLVFNEYIYGKSFREILGYIAAANSGFARVVPELVVINEETGESVLKSRLQFVTYKDTGIVLRMNNDDDTPNLYSKIKSVKSGTNKFGLKKIATTAYVKNKDTESEDNPNDENKSAYATATITYPANSNAKPYETLEFDCPFIASSGCYIRDGVVRIDYATEQNLKAIYDEISQISYYPIDATLFGYHFLECGDIVKIENTYGEILDLYIQDVKMTVGGGVTVTVSSKYDYTKSNTLKNSVTARVDSLAKELHSFANNFEISKNKIEMSVSKAEAETIIQENLADLNMGVNQWIREVYNLDGVEGIEKPRSIQLQGKSPIITDIIKDPEDAKFPTLEEFTGTEEENNNGAIFGTRTVRYATCVKVNERTTIGIMVRQGYENTSFIPEFDNVAVYVNTDLKLPPDINTQDGVREYLKLSKLDKVVHGVDENGEPTTELVPEEITEGTEHYGYYTYNAVLNAGWNIIEIMHYENIGNYLEIKCGRVDVEDINVVDDIQDVNELHEVDIFTKSPFIGLVNCNALSITYTRFVGAEFTIESDAIKQVVTEITDMTKKVGELETTYDSISARVEETRIDIEDLETKYTEIKNTADEITLTANQTKESVEEIGTKMDDTIEVVTSLESQLSVKIDEISTYVKEEISYTKGDIEQNYVQKSEMEQNNAEIKMTFSQSGGYNLIQESAFYNDEAFGQDGVWRLKDVNGNIPYMRYTYEDKLGYPDPNANTLYLNKLSSTLESWLGSCLEQDIELVPGKTYTFSMQFASPDGENSWAKVAGYLDFVVEYNGRIIHQEDLWISATEESINNGEDGNRMTEGGKTDEGWIKCKSQFSIPKSYGMKKDTNEDGVIDDNDIEPLKFTVGIRFIRTPHESRLLIVHPLLVEGELDMVYSPNPNEMYTGVTRINKDGIKVSRSDSTVATTIDYRGMTITTDQSVAAEFRSDYAYVPVARIDKVINSNIPTKGSKPNVLIVSKTKYEQNPDENTFRTLQECFDSIPDITTSEITIEIQDHTNGGYLRDKSGSPIEIILYKDIRIGSTIILSNINNSLYIHSEDETFERNKYPYGYVRGIACSNCHNVSIGYLHLDELTYADADNLNELGIGISAYRNVSTAIILEGSTATVKYCNLLNSINYNKNGIDISCITAARNSRCITYNCRGNSSSRTNVKYVYLSLGYSFLYIARHSELLKDTNENINTDGVVNVLPEGIKLIKFPNNEANLTTFTNREYESNSDNFDKYPEADVNVPSYDKIEENVRVYSNNRHQQTRHYENSNGKYMIISTVNGGSNVGTVRLNNKYYYERTIFEFEPEKFRSALSSAQTKVYDENGNPINGEAPVKAKLVIEAEAIGEYVNRKGYPSSKYVPVNVLMYSKIEYAFDDSKQDSADPKFNEGIKENQSDKIGKYDFVPNNILASNTAYLVDNDNDWTYENHGFYPENMRIEIPVHFNMASLNNGTSSSYRNGVEDMKNGKLRFVIIDTGIYAQDDEGNLIQGETATVKIKDVYFDLSYEVSEALKPTSELRVPDYRGYTDFYNRYQNWSIEHDISCVKLLEYSETVSEGGFINTTPKIGSLIDAGERLEVTVSKGEEPEIQPIEIPDMYGWTQEKVSEWAEPNNIYVTFASYPTIDVASGLVVSSSPSAGLTVMPGGYITVYYAVPPTGGDLIVPDYSSYSDFESRYEDWCGKNNIILVIALEYSNSIPKDGFIRTNPSVGSAIRSGGTLSLYESKGPGGNLNPGTTNFAPSESALYPVMQERYFNTSGTLVCNTYSGEDLLDDNSSAGSFTEKNGITYHRRTIHKFDPSDFSRVLKNADLSTLTAEIVLVDDVRALDTLDSSGFSSPICACDETDNLPEYIGYAPFKVDINSSVNEIMDSPNDINGSIYDGSGNAIISVGSDVKLAPKLSIVDIPSDFKDGQMYDYKAVRIPIRFSGSGTTALKNGKLQYLVIDSCDLGIKTGYVGLRFLKSYTYIELSFKENGKQRIERIDPWNFEADENYSSGVYARPYRNRYMGICLDTTEQQMRKFTGTAEYQYSDVDCYQIVSTTTNNNLFGVTKSGSEYQFYRVIMEIDTAKLNDFLPSDFLPTAENNYYGSSLSATFKVDMKDRTGSLFVGPNDLTYGDVLPFYINIFSNRSDIDLVTGPYAGGACYYDLPRSGLTAYFTDSEGIIQPIAIGSGTGEYKLFDIDGLIQDWPIIFPDWFYRTNYGNGDLMYDDEVTSRTAFKDGRAKYIVIDTSWADNDGSGHNYVSYVGNAILKRAYLKTVVRLNTVEGLSEVSKASLLTIEDDYLEE